MQIDTSYINELGIAIVSRDESKLHEVASKLSANYSGGEIKRVWREVEGELCSKDVIWVHERLKGQGELMELSTPLTLEEQSKKQAIEDKFRNFLQTYIEMGKDLIYLKENKLYREEYPSWNTYCQYTLGITARHADRLIQATQLVEYLKQLGGLHDQLVLPPSESVAREVLKVPQSNRLDVWDTVVEKHLKEDEPITADMVARVVKESKAETFEAKQEIIAGELVRLSQGKNSSWGEVTSIFSDGTCVFNNGSKEIITTVNKVQKLDSNYITCHRINQLHASTNKEVQVIASSLHQVFTFQPWHLDIINILESQCN